MELIFLINSFSLNPLVNLTMEEEVLENYFKAGEIVHKVLEKAMNIVSAGKRVLDICESLEAEIRKLGGEPAFPVNISINEIAAHYTSPPGDTTTIPEGGLIKVDVGAQVRGYIADAAVTIALSDEFEELIKAARDALKVAESELRAGVNLGRIGALIERLITATGFKPIKNLSGHLIDRYELHAGKSVPNVGIFTLERAKEGEVYAIEPFVTNGKGRVKEGNEVYIFSLRSLKGLKGDLRELAESLWRNYKGLPFATRWLTKELSLRSVGETLIRLLERGVLYPYPVLIEEGGGMVAQWEDTLIVKKGRPVNITRTLEIIR